MKIVKPTAVTDGEDIEQVSFRQTTEGLVLYDGTNNRLILGQLPDGTIGLVISREGYDVFDELAS